MSETPSLGWRGMVPHYYKYSWEDFKLEAKPIGIRRLLQFIPYLTGGKPIFQVTIDTISREQRLLSAHVQLFDPTGKKESWRRLSLPNRPIKGIHDKIELHPISVSGDHYLRVYLIWYEGEAQKKTTLDLVSFRAIAQETMIGWIIGVLLVIGGIIIGILNLIYRL